MKLFKTSKTPEAALSTAVANGVVPKDAALVATKMIEQVPPNATTEEKEAFVREKIQERRSRAGNRFTTLDMGLDLLSLFLLGSAVTGGTRKRQRHRGR